MNLAALLRRNALAFRERPAVALGPRVLLDYGALYRRVTALAGALRAHGLGPGDRVVLLMANAPEYVDETGFLTLLDRSKDVIITGGANVYPREVEEVLLGHPDVVEVCALGEPDPEWGERVAAYVVAAPGAVLDPADLDRLCLERMARFKRPRSYRFVDQLPKSAYGKILKRELRN